MLSLSQRIALPVNFSFIPGTRYWFNNDPNIRIFIPDDPYFSLIKGVVLNGTGLYESYKKAGQMLSPTGELPLEKLYPNPILAMAIKFNIFDAVNYISGKPVSRPYGDGVWIHEQASKILEMYFLGDMSKPGRMAMSDQIILPTQAEQVCIRNSIQNANHSIYGAFQQCNCYDILPVEPSGFENKIETLIKTTNYTFFYIYMIVLTTAQIPLPEDEPLPTDNLPGTSNYAKYLILGFIGLAVLANKGQY